MKKRGAGVAGMRVENVAYGIGPDGSVNIGVGAGETATCGILTITRDTEEYCLVLAEATFAIPNAGNKNGRYTGIVSCRIPWLSKI